MLTNEAKVEQSQAYQEDFSQVTEALEAEQSNRKLAESEILRLQEEMARCNMRIRELERVLAGSPLYDKQKKELEQDAQHQTSSNNGRKNSFQGGLSKEDQMKAAMKQRMTADRQSFLAKFDMIVEELVHKAPVPDLSAHARERIRSMIHYNVMGGKLTRGLSVLEAFRSCVAPRPPTEEEISHCQTVGWAIEFMQAAFLVADDIMDNSTLRRNKACWYKLDSVGVLAMNDAFLLEGLAYHVLRRGCGKCSWYPAVMDLIHDICLKTELGQMMDLWVERSDVDDPFVKYTAEMYDQIVVNKTAYYSFAMPVLCGMHIAGAATEAAVRVATQICLELGRYFQMQDDYLDCYGDVETLGKVGTDIQERKCSWLFVTARSLASPDLLATLLANYGNHNPEQIAAVRGVYDCLDLPGHYARESDKQYAYIKHLIDSAVDVPKPVFLYLLHKIHGRSK